MSTENKEVKGPKTAVVLAASLHVRADHSTASETLSSLVKGDEVEVLGTWSDGASKWAKLADEKWAAMEHDGQILMKFKE
jgi:hypothetical protein